MSQNVQLPDGRTLQFPDGMSQADMAAAIKKNFPEIHGGVDTDALQKQLAAVPVASRRAAYQRLSPIQRAALADKIKADVRAANSPEAREARYQAIQKQNVDEMPWYQKVAAGAGQSLYDTGRGIGQLVGLNSQADIDTARRQDAALLGSGAGRIGQVVGQGLQMAIPVGDGAKVLGWAGKAAPYIGAAARSGLFMAAQPTQVGESRVRNTLTGLVEGAGGRALSPLLGKAASPVTGAIKQAAIDLAEKYQIPLHLSQVADSNTLKLLSSVAKHLPFSGTAGAARAQQAAFNRAVTRQIGENAESITDDVLTRAKQRIGSGYDALWSRNAVKLTPADAQKLVTIANDATRYGGKDVGQVVGNHIDSIIGHLDTHAQMPGKLYQSLRTDQLLPAENGANPSAAHYVRQVRTVLQEAADRSVGKKDAAELAKLNGEYNSLKIIEKAVTKRAAGAGGDVIPAHLWSLVNGKYGSTQEMRDLARLGQTVLKDPIPDSGTAARNVMYGALGAGGYAAPHAAIPAAAAGATIGRLLNSPGFARVAPYLGKNTLKALTQVARLAPYAAPVATRQIQEGAHPGVEGATP